MPPPEASPRVERIAYGEGRDRYGDLWLPPGPVSAPLRPVVLVHGGYWRARWRLDLMDGLAADVARRGMAAWNIEYRRVGAGGGWPATFDDVAAAVDHLAVIAAGHDLDVGAAVAVGHSAGGHLALWAAGRQRLAAGLPGASPRVLITAVVALAAVADLHEAARRRLSDGAAQDLLGGGPDEVADRYDAASPPALLPLGARLLLVHGDADEDVPVDLSRSLHGAAMAAGDRSELLVLPGVDHFALIDPASPAWARAAAWVEALGGGAPVPPAGG